MSNPEYKWEIISTRTYKDQFCMSIINYGMYTVFDIPATNNIGVQWDLFQHVGRFPLKYVISHF